MGMAESIIYFALSKQLNLLQIVLNQTLGTSVQSTDPSSWQSASPVRLWDAAMSDSVTQSPLRHRSALAIMLFINKLRLACSVAYGLA
jgi:hypothetical protein